MLLEFVLVALSVALGVILGFAGLLCLFMNKKVLKWYTKKTMEMTAEITDKMF